MNWQVFCDGVDISNTLINFNFQSIYAHVKEKSSVNVQVFLNDITIDDFEYSYAIANHPSVAQFSITGIISGNPSLCNMSKNPSKDNATFSNKCTIMFTNIRIGIKDKIKRNTKHK